MSGWRGLRAAARLLVVRQANWPARESAAAARQLNAAEPVLAAVWQRVSWQRCPFTTSSAAAASAPCERLPDKQEANELDGRLQEAGRQGADAVLELIEREGERFTELNVVTAMQAVADACSRSGASEQSVEAVVRSTPFQTLVDMVLAGMMRFEPSLLCQALASCGQLGASEEMLLDEVGRHLMAVVGQLGADDVAAAVHAYAALGHSPSSVLFEALAQRAAQLAPHFSPDQRGVVADSYQRLGYASLAPNLGG